MKDIRDNLKTAIERSGMKQIAVAERANLSPAKLSGILNKKRKLEAGEMFSICEVINISPERLKLFSTDQDQTDKAS
ncbi:helix-turn-helix domain-containing protein [Marasmitruncus massiliensis]|uniref:helix-turn-helix domain-containing protein n=1 Tax=Marasmitruncus massiliensis TaxID=1944642 RepID=UPI000C79F215|nr:helix-turn-helix transcriptional regulator [Marasmitruncus massiliensis]